VELLIQLIILAQQELTLEATLLLLLMIVYHALEDMAVLLLVHLNQLLQLFANQAIFVLEEAKLLLKGLALQELTDQLRKLKRLKIVFLALMAIIVQVLL